MPVPGAEQNWLKRSLLHIGGYYTRESQLIRGSKVLYADIVEQSTNKEFYKGATPSLNCYPVHCILIAKHAIKCTPLMTYSKDYGWTEHANIPVLPLPKLLRFRIIVLSFDWKRHRHCVCLRPPSNGPGVPVCHNVLAVVPARVAHSGAAAGGGKEWQGPGANDVREFPGRCRASSACRGGQGTLPKSRLCRRPSTYLSSFHLLLTDVYWWKVAYFGYLTGLMVCVCVCGGSGQGREVAH